MKTNLVKCQQLWACIPRSSLFPFKPTKTVRKDTLSPTLLIIGYIAKTQGLKKHQLPKSTHNLLYRLTITVILKQVIFFCNALYLKNNPMNHQR